MSTRIFPVQTLWAPIRSRAPAGREDMGKAPVRCGTGISLVGTWANMQNRICAQTSGDDPDSRSVCGCRCAWPTPDQGFTLPFASAIDSPAFSTIFFSASVDMGLFKQPTTFG